MAVLPAGEIGGWSETRLTRFVEDWFRSHQLPATKAIQVDALTIGTRSLTDLVTSFNKRTGDVLPQTGDYTAALIANALDLSNGGTQVLAGTLNAGGLQVGGKALPGSEIGYDQTVTPVNVASVSSGAPTAFINGSSHAFDGSPVRMEFYSPQAITPSVAGGSVSVGLYDNAAPTTLIAFESLVTPAAANLKAPIFFSLRFTPSAGNHTFNIGTFCSVTTGTPSIQAGAGSGGTQPPAYIRFTKV
jgi:hypothetical protein